MKILIVAFFSLFLSQLSGQEHPDSVIFRALSDEMARTRQEFRLPDAKYEPFYMRFVLIKAMNTQISASLGALTMPVNEEVSRMVMPLILFGDATDGQRPGGTTLLMGGAGQNDDYNQIRQSLWLVADRAYRRTYDAWVAEQKKKSEMQQSEINAENVEFTPTPAVTSIAPDLPAFNTKLWTDRAIELSKEFEKFKELYATRVQILLSWNGYYAVSSENVRLKVPSMVIKMIITATRNDAKGMPVKWDYSRSFENEAGMPSMESLKSEIALMVNELDALVKAPVEDANYTGPLMVEGEGSIGIFWDAILGRASGGIFNKAVVSSANNSSDLGKRLCDSRISLTVYSDKREYKGTPIKGAHGIDHDGFRPAPERTLIKNGVVVAQLAWKHHVKDGSVPTGNTRYSAASTGTGMGLGLGFYPGFMHFSASEGTTVAKMRKQLLEMAAKRGLKYAYIMRKKEYQEKVYRVYVDSGKEEWVRTSPITPAVLSRYQKSPMDLVAVSKTETLIDVPSTGPLPAVLTMVVPEALLFEEISLGKVTGTIFPPAIPHPDKR